MQTVPNVRMCGKDSNKLGESRAGGARRDVHHPWGAALPWQSPAIPKPFLPHCSTLRGSVMAQARGAGVPLHH